MMFNNHIKESPFLGIAGFGGGISWGSIQKYIDAVYVEEVFSTYVYTGNATNRTITNGIDLSGEGGMVWIKSRTNTTSHVVQDTERGTSDYLSTDSSASESSPSPPVITAFNSDGFDLGTNNLVNGTGDIASWTFRKAPGFFDVVTYTGDGVAGRTVPHNLGSVPGMIWVKRENNIGNWRVYHRSEGSTRVGVLNEDESFSSGTSFWNDTTPTSSEFTLGVNTEVNGLNSTYVAYLFAHDDARFGDNSDQSIIKCGTYTGDGNSDGPVIDLGWEPQWLLIKRSESLGDWSVFDNMRGWAYADDDKILKADSIDLEVTLDRVSPLPNGFKLTTSNPNFNKSAGTYVYMAIRRGLMKTPTDATKLFAASAGANVTTAGQLAYNSGFPIDWIIEGWSTTNYAYDRFMPTYDYNRPSENLASAADGGFRSLVSNEGSPYDSNFNLTVYPAVGWCFRRAPGFFDMVAYTGTSANRTVDHSLGVVPELIIVKAIDGATSWYVYSATIGATKALVWDTDAVETTQATVWNNTAPTASAFTVGTLNAVNNTGVTFHAYLFASLGGISKVGTYTGTGAALDIDCGFAAGARFVMVKRTDSTGNWYVWDTTTGIVASNEDYRKVDDGALVSGTDYIDPLSSGFTLSSAGSSDTNINTATYIYLAIA